MEPRVATEKKRNGGYLGKQERNLTITASTKEEESAKEPSKLLILLIIITLTERSPGSYLIQICRAFKLKPQIQRG